MLFTFYTSPEHFKYMHLMQEQVFSSLKYGTFPSHTHTDAFCCDATYTLEFDSPQIRQRLL